MNLVYHTKPPTKKTILRYHMRSRGWKDIAYHFLVDPRGKVR